MPAKETGVLGAGRLQAMQRTGAGGGGGQNKNWEVPGVSLPSFRESLVAWGPSDLVLVQGQGHPRVGNQGFTLHMSAFQDPPCSATVSSRP